VTTCGGANCLRPGELTYVASILLKELFVGSGSFQMDVICGSGVDQHPIRFNVSIAVSGPIEFEWVVFVLRGQGLPGEEKLDQVFEFFEVFASLLEPFRVAVKLG
jgi:hypothetical protein